MTLHPVQEKFTEGRGYSRQDWDEVSDNPEWTDEELANPLTLEQILPELAASVKQSEFKIGSQQSSTKQLVSLLIDSDILDRFKATGEGWQARINSALKNIKPA